MEVRASQGPQQAGRIPINALSSVRPVNVHVQSVRPVVCAFWLEQTHIPLVLFVDRVVARLIGLYICWLGGGMPYMPYKV